METYCNPLDLGYRYQHMKEGERIAGFREGADPTLVYFSRFTGGTPSCRTGFRSLRRSMARMKGGKETMTEAECRAEIRKFFMELYPACTVIYSYPGNAARPPAPYVVLDFDAADSSQIDEYVDDGILRHVLMIYTRTTISITLIALYIKVAYSFR